MAYNPSYQHPRQPSVSNPSHHGAIPPHSQPVNPPYNPSGPRDIPHRGSYGQPNAPGQYYGTTPPQAYGTTPPMHYGTTPPGHFSTGQMYGTSPSQNPQMYGTTPPQQQYLAPIPSQPSYPQPQAGYSAPQSVYSASQQGRPRGGSTSSHHSHKSHHSSYSKHSRHDEKGGRRKNSRVESPRPSFGDTMTLVWSSLKGAFDSRK
jgi:hypothetical protein